MRNHHILSTVFLAFMGIFLFMSGGSAEEITRLTSLDVSPTASSTLQVAYHSGSGAEVGRYAVFVIQQYGGGGDILTTVAYGGKNATLLKKRLVAHAQGGDDYYYIYGLPNPTAGTSTIEIVATGNLYADIVAATYSYVHPVQPDVTGGEGSSASLSSWTTNFTATTTGELAIIASADNNGSMAPGTNTSRLSTARGIGGGVQVWEGGIYEDAGSNSFNLVGANGGGTDVTYAVLLPFPQTAPVERLTSLDASPSASSTLQISYNSGSGTEIGRYATFVVQQYGGGGDILTGVTYNGDSATLLKKRLVANAQGGDDYYYIYGLANPTAGTSTLRITGSAPISADVVAVTYSGIHPTQPDATGGEGSSASLTSWTSNFSTSNPESVAIIASADNNGAMTAGDNTSKLSTTRSSGAGVQVWQGGVYENAGSNSFNLVGANGGGTDVTYVVLKPLISS